VDDDFLIEGDFMSLFHPGDFHVIGVASAGNGGVM
jgi:hypothetical protein